MDINNSISLLDKNKLLQIFAYLNERLKENQLQLEITIYGGSIMTMVYDNRPATKDIDCVFKNRLLEVVSGYIPLAILGERQINFIKYLGKDLGYDWE